MLGLSEVDPLTLAIPSARLQSSGMVAVVAVRYESARPYYTDQISDTEQYANANSKK